MDHKVVVTNGVATPRSGNPHLRPDEALEVKQ